MKQKVSGFTIVEVALVLAVAGMIFAITLAVLPNLWANERDAARREDMMKFVTQIKNFQTNNNRGALPKPNSAKEFESTKVVSVNGGEVASDRENKKDDNATTWAGFYRDFFDDDFRDPNGSYYDLNVVFCDAKKSDERCANKELENMSKLTTINNTIYVAVSAVCDGDTAVKSANARRVAVVYRLERAGQYCYND